MTGHAERIKAGHRGVALAAPAARSREVALQSFGLRYERVDDFNVVVEGGFQLNLAMSYWRSIGDPSRHGYLVSALAAEIRKPNPEKPAAGRDSTRVRPKGAAIAESVAGSLSSGAGSASLLPAVMP